MRLTRLGRIVLAIAASASLAAAQTSVLSNRYNTYRTGATLNETTLNTSNVNSEQFGKLFRYPVDGSVFAQPLYLPNVPIAKQGLHNVLYICTMNDSVYAFDADKNATLWSVNFTNPSAGVTPVPIADIVGHNNGDIVGPVGIESTPVIDPSTGTMYLVARTKESSGSTINYVQRLHALDVASGAEKFGGPVVISASVSGTGQQSANEMVPFNSKMNNQRAGLAFASGQIVIAWSSHEDTQPYHGWVMSYSASTLAQTGVFCDTPDGQQGGIWQSGRAPVVDALGNVYVFTGNGTTDSSSDLSEAALRFSTTNGIQLKDYFVADNYSNLNNGDLDLGSAGPIWMPGFNMLVGGGKQGIIYLLNPKDLGHYTSGDTQIPQQFQATSENIRPGPAFWTSADKGPLLYLWGEGSVLQAFHFNGTTFDTTPLLQGTVSTPSGAPGATISISSSGTIDSSAIVWGSTPAGVYEDVGLPAGILYALAASNPSQMLWSSAANPRDEAGYYAKFVPPMVANGKMYMPTFSDYTGTNYVNVYGLLTPSLQFTLSLNTPGVALTPGSNAEVTVTVGPQPGHSFNGTVQLSVAGLPESVTATFNPPAITGVGTSILTLAADNKAALGGYALTVTGAGAKSGTTSSAPEMLTVTSLPGVISIDIVGLGTAMPAIDFAGVVLKSNWNNMTGGTQSVPQPLIDENGNATAAAATWVATAPYDLPIANTPANFTMMQGYFDSGNLGTMTFSVTGLPATPNGYLVYVYADGDNQGNTRQTTYTVSGPNTNPSSLVLTDLANADFNGTFTQVTATSSAGNYMIFPATYPGFTITGIPVSSSNGAFAPLNGVQIVPQ